LQQFFDFLSDLFYRNKKSNYKTIQKLNKNTTINELFAIFKNYGALSEEAKGIKEERFLKLEKTQLENLIRLNAGDIENHKKELEIIIQKLHTLERYDVNNLDQLKQQLAEVNKKISEVESRYDNQIKDLRNQLESLLSKEQPTSTTQSEIEAKKADIERRRQEELGRFGTSEEKTSKNSVKVLGVDEYVSRELMELAYSNDSGNNPEIGGGGQTLNRIIERGGYSKEELSKLLKPEIDKINAKYDAELKVLENKDLKDNKNLNTIESVINQIKDCKS
jgi:TolA-binding protein